MRHVTDGELHAFLDGGLDLLPDGRGKEVREHLSDCPVCRERLQDEEAIRAKAGELLGDPGLGELALPTFEELREMAEAPGEEPPLERSGARGGLRRRGPLRGLPLAWAATIVLALGVGWMGGKVWQRLPEDSAGVFRSTGSSPAPVPGTTGIQERLDRPDEVGQTTVVAPSRPESESPSQGEEGARPVQEEMRAALTESPRGAPASSVELEVLPEEARFKAVEALTPPLTGAVAGVGDTVSPVAAQERRARAEVLPPPDVGADAASTRAEREAQGMPRVLVETQANPVAGDSLENSLAVPGLKVVSIEWEERIPGEKALLIRQLLSPGDTLELRYLGMLLGAEPKPVEPTAVSQVEEAPRFRSYAGVLEASLPPGWHQVAMEKDRVLLVARGPVSEENLKALLMTLH